MSSISASDDAVQVLAGLVNGGRSPEDAYLLLGRMIGDSEAKATLVRFYELTGRYRQFRDPPALVAEDLARRFTAWYTGPAMDDISWPRLKSTLAARGLPVDAVESIDRASDKILSLLPSSGEPAFAARGLVIGYVQSGKTANYSALIAKAADRGYRLFIVLSGIHNSLREQTQSRLNSELRDLAQDRWITLTDESADFRLVRGVAPAAAVLAAEGRTRILLVVKKNDRVLGKLQRWLDAAGLETRAACPTIVIDDEADQAGVNTARGDERSKINKRLVTLLATLPRAAYVGYTATPFANVLVDPAPEQGLYPRDFIVDLPRPRGYYGTEALFGRERLDTDEEDQAVLGLDVIRPVPDDEIPLLRPVQKDRLTFKPSITKSLARAIRYFWLATAARRARSGRSEHSSMLIHTTLYAKPHKEFRAPVRAFTDAAMASIDAGDEAELRAIWADEGHRVLAPELTPVSFDALNIHLRDVIEATEILVDNNTSDERLVYGDKPRVVIVVGGNTLSRGLTLEGLTVSYFIRTASAYDTLLQMGRWFGYRLGYQDLPRIWMTRELESAFRDLALVEHEIRSEVARYERDRVTPLDYGPRIRTHPALSVTSALKMQKAVTASMSFSGREVQTIIFDHRDPGVVSANLGAMRALVESSIYSGDYERKGSRLLLRDMGAAAVIDFVLAYHFHPSNRELNTSLLKGYIEDQLALGQLATWNVAVVGRSHSRRSIELGGIEFGLLERSRIDRGDDSEAYLGIITSKTDYSCDLPIAYPDGHVPTEERLRAGPLLLLYLISRNSEPLHLDRRAGGGKRVALNAIDDLVGAAFVFPRASEETAQEYVTVDLSGVPREFEEEAPQEDEEPEA